MNVREQLERTTGGVLAAGHVAAPWSASRLLVSLAVLLVLALIATFAFDAGMHTRGTMMTASVATNFLLGGMGHARTDCPASPVAVEAVTR